MPPDFYIFRTQINATLKRYLLLKGTFWAGMGTILMVVSGIFIPKALLSVWGPLFFFIGFTLITFGLLPYRKLMRLEQWPDELHIYEDKLLYFQNRKLSLTLPLINIELIDYKEDIYKYGIIVNIKIPLPKKIILHKFDKSLANDLLELGTKNEIMFSYFSINAYEEILDILKIEIK